MVVFDILNVDKVCTVILHTYLTYAFTNLQQQAKTILGHSGYEYMNTPEQVMLFNHGLCYILSFDYKFTLTKYVINNKEFVGV